MRPSHVDLYKKSHDLVQSRGGANSRQARGGLRMRRERCLAGRDGPPPGSLLDCRGEIFGYTRRRRAPRTHASLASLGGRQVPQCAPGAAGSARSHGPHAYAEGIPMRRRTARAPRTAALDEPPRCMGQDTAERSARHLARALHRADRDRRGARPDRSGVGAASVALGARRAEALSAGAGNASRAAAASMWWSSRTTTTITSTTRPSARWQTRVPFVTSLGVGAHLESWGVAAAAHHRARLVGIACGCPMRT